MFRTLQPDFASFLDRVASAPEARQPRFAARNFLIDESVLEPRVHSYGDYGAKEGFEDSDDWAGAHREYLKGQVWLQQMSSLPPKTLDTAKTDRCPETFRHAESYSTFGTANKQLDLLRVLDVGVMARFAGRPEPRLVEAARSVVDAGAKGKEAPALDRTELQGALHAWNRQCDLRPVFATFLADHGDLFGDRPEEDQAGWADELRDRLGLNHHDPGARGDVHLFVFRYPVSSVPGIRGAKRVRPLALPTVLDGNLSEAFCPAPRNEMCGHTVHLADPGGIEPCREVVHPTMELRVDHLFRAGQVKKPAPTDLGPARAAHLRSLRTLYDRPDYASRTDPEST